MLKLGWNRQDEREENNLRKVPDPVHIVDLSVLLRFNSAEAS